MRFLFLHVLLLIPSIILAEQKDSIFVSQFVRDSFTRYGVRNAFVTVMNLDGHVLDTVRTQPGNGSHDAQVWQLTVPRRNTTFRIRVEHTDYETNEMVVEMKNPARLNSFHFPDMLLQRVFSDKEVSLDEVTVKATRVKLCYKGDTIEVDARAFKLTEGSMLESLVKNVPGCELHDNGDIYMNGRKVDYLTLNGKDFFKGNNRIMLDNLPYYTVDKLQFFNQRSERSQLAGKDIERPDFIMNVKLKQEYSIGYLGNAEAGAGTHGRWMGRGFALRFTDNSRISLFGNANNINESRHPGEDGKWGQSDSPESDTDTYNVGGELLVDDKHGHYKEVLNASLLWNKSHSEQRTASQQFIQQGDIFGYSSGVATKQGLKLKAENKLTLKRVGLISDTRFDYSDYDNDAMIRSAQFTEQPGEDLVQVLDSIFSTSQSSEMLGIMVNNVQDASSNSGKRWTAEQKFDYHKALPWGDDLMLRASGLWNGTKNDGNSYYGLKYADGGTPDDIQNRLLRGKSHSYDLQFGVGYAIHFLTDWHLYFDLTHHQQHTKEQNNLYRLDWDENFRPGEMLPSLTDYLHLRDANNSPDIDNSLHEEHVTASLHKHVYDSRRGRYFSFTTALNTRYVSNNGVYIRGENTARPSDHRWLFRPSVDIELETRQWHDSYKLHYDTKMRPIDLAQVADLTDTSNPLTIQKGNPNLRPGIVHNLSFLFSSRFGTHGQFAFLRSAITIMNNLEAMNSIYNRNTGAYTFMPVNVNGNWTYNSSLNLRRALTENRRLNIESRTVYNYQHAVDMKDNAKSTVRQHVAEQNLTLEYKSERFVLSLLSGVSWNGMRLADVEDINNMNFNYGANIQADLPFKLHLSTDIRMYSRRSYADRSLCTDNLLWNAQINRTFFNGQLIASVKAFDLLHQISSTHTTFNSQACIETWHLSLPSYFMLSVQYRFNKNPEKKR
ncbi:MAG: outer membrane beta-barrel family protein [Prevotellaceae bacterium]|nr:outer membrane beta-barrel family protein [Prevotellaceae bacterium]